MSSSFMGLILILASMGNNELLDYVHTDTYWKAKGVEVSVVSMTGELDQTVEDKAAASQPASDAPKAQAVRRLMAIRTLGELKRPEALDVLKPLLKSKVMFEADYAARAIASIEGKAVPVVAPSDLSNDAWLMPRGCGIVGQISLSTLVQQDIKAILSLFAPMMGGMDEDRCLQQMTMMIISVAERTGNMRLDGVTIAVSEEFDGRDDTSFIVLLARGQYDAQALKGLLAADTKTETEAVKGVDVVSVSRNWSFILPSDNVLALAGAASRGSIPVEEMVAAIKSGMGGVDKTSDVGKLLAGVDMKSSLWAVMKVGDSYGRADILAPFEYVTLQSKSAKGGTTFSINAQGREDGDVLAAVEMLKQGKSMADEMMTDSVAEMPFLKPYVELLSSVKVEVKDKAVEITASHSEAHPVAMLSTVVMLFSSSRQSRSAVTSQPSEDSF